MNVSSPSRLALIDVLLCPCRSLELDTRAIVHTHSASTRRHAMRIIDRHRRLTLSQCRSVHQNLTPFRSRRGPVAVSECHHQLMFSCLPHATHPSSQSQMNCEATILPKVRFLMSQCATLIFARGTCRLSLPSHARGVDRQRPRHGKESSI